MPDYKLIASQIASLAEIDRDCYTRAWSASTGRAFTCWTGEAFW